MRGETMNKHTPGPWTIEMARTRAMGRILHGNFIVAYVEGLHPDQAPDGALADALLIAAAPELLLALERLYLLCIGAPTTYEGEKIISDLREFNRAIAQAGAAIRKAKRGNYDNL
jgi:hypothetical protein